MNLWKKNLKDITFSDVEEFCRDEIKEGIQLDYKIEMPRDGVKKHFASFANTRGGLIIFGVDEDRKTGLPKGFEGVDNPAKLVQRVHQQSVHIEPGVRFEVHATDLVSDKAFVVLKVLEGPTPPYYIHNDPNIWVRTGDISDPIDIASPNAARLLFDKKLEAEKYRTNNLLKASRYFDALIKIMESERLSTIAQEKAQFRKQQEAATQSGNPIASDEEYQSFICQEPIGSNSSTLTVALQPLYPIEALTTVTSLKDEVISYRSTGALYGDLPTVNLYPLQDGVYEYKWRPDTGLYNSTQVYATGLVYDSHDVRHDDGSTKNIRMYYIAARVFMTLQCASNLYKLYGYAGSAELTIKLDRVEGTRVARIADGTSFFTMPILLPEYAWQRTIDTMILSDKVALVEEFYSIMKEIHRSLGEPDIDNDEINILLSQQGWLPGKQ